MTPLIILLVFGVIEYGWMLLKSQDISNAARSGARAGVYYNGEFYDNVFVRDRGGNTSDGIKLDFNKDDRFRWDPNTARVDEINLNYHSAFDESNLRAILSFDAFRDAGQKALTAAPWRPPNGEPSLRPRGGSQVAAPA